MARHTFSDVSGMSISVTPSSDSASMTALTMVDRLPEIGARVLATEPAAARDLARIVEMWSTQLAASGGPFLFGGFSIADAYYAPVCARLRSYALPMPAVAAAYVDRIFALPSVQAWVADALAEHEFLAADEPYRSAPSR